MGRKAKPAHLHIVAGNASKLSAAELSLRAKRERAAVIAASLPSAPVFLSAEAKVEWSRLGVELVKVGLICELDRAAFAVYCQAYAEWVVLSSRVDSGGIDGMIDETANGYKQISAWVSLRDRSADRMLKIMSEFGLTPASRAKVMAACAQMSLPGFDDGDQNPAQAAKARFFGAA